LTTFHALIIAPHCGERKSVTGRVGDGLKRGTPMLGSSRQRETFPRNVSDLLYSLTSSSLSGARRLLLGAQASRLQRALKARVTGKAALFLV
jgi:hypothetical protein